MKLELDLTEDELAHLVFIVREFIPLHKESGLYVDEIAAANKVINQLEK